MLKTSAPAQEEEEDPLAYYENHTSQIEVKWEALGVSWGVVAWCELRGVAAWRGPRPGVTRCRWANQIVRQDRSMEQIVFPVPAICQFLTEETKHRLFTTTEQDEQGSKVSDFFDQSSFLHNEMEWQRRLRSEDQRAPPPLPGASLGRGVSGDPSTPHCVPRHATHLLVLPTHDTVGQHLLQPGGVHQHHHCLLLPLRGGRVHG